MMTSPTQERSLGELFKELAMESATLVRREVDLAKVEMTAKAKTAGRKVSAIAVGGAVAMLGALALLAFVILLLGEVMSLWASALIVGAVVTAIGSYLVIHGLRTLKEIDPAPRETIRTLNENKQWLREQVSR